MPTSDGSARSARTLLKVLLAVAFVVVCDIALTFVLEPYGSNSESVWHEYRQLTASGERFETVCLGSSIAQDSLQPAAVDTTLQTTSFCLASPGQSLVSSYEALQEAVADHPIKRVILGTSYMQMAQVPWANSSMACTQAMLAGQLLDKMVSGYTRLLMNPDYVGKIDSLAFLMPFLLNHVSYTPSAIMSNVHNRLTCASPLEAEALIDANWVPLGHGYANHTGQVDTETHGANLLGVNNIEWLGLTGKGLNASELRGLEGICRLCQERGIELVVYAPPEPRFEILSMAQTYPEGMAQVQDLVTSYGGLFMDFNMVHDDIYDVQEKDFIDANHLNTQGAERFASLLADFVRRAEADEDLSGLFYAYGDWDDFLRSIDQITYVWFTTTPEGADVRLDAIAYTGSLVKVEYAYEVEDSATGSWTRVRDWSKDPSCLLSGGTYQLERVRVLARRQGATEAERCHYQTVTVL